MLKVTELSLVVTFYCRISAMDVAHLNFMICVFICNTVIKNKS